MQESASGGGVRLDKWLWAARFFKTRSLASEEIGTGRVEVNGQRAKASREVRVGDRIEFRQAGLPRIVIVSGTSQMRGPAPIAAALYAETADSVLFREAALHERKTAPDPGAAIDHGRPTKRGRRQLAEWNRWSASIEPD